ncbi:MAG TPA: hypothetical protein PLO29_02610 [Paludibacter sp.]|nr:MAG: hypothetical protein BWY08_00915 [Bacteroidetes bacterium ADurb.Bin174]HQB27819.1 hypothetical protein [Paludibacter sp.]
MKTRRIILSLILFAVWMPLQLMAQRLSHPYDLSDYLDLEAVATVFAQSRNIKDFEYRLNDYRNQVSNLDLNNDGYVDYLRVIKLYDRSKHVILIQAVLNHNYYQDVATIIVGRDYYNGEYIQIIGEPSLFGADYIVEPIFVSRPRVVRWLWSYPTTIYVSKYYWGYYPRVYLLRTVLPIHHYFNHVNVFVNVNHYYHYTTHVRYPVYTQTIHHYSRNDYWRNNPGYRFDQRNRDYKNKGSFQYHQERKKPEVKDRITGSSETERRQLNQGTTTQRPQPRVTPTIPKTTTPQREVRTSTPNATKSQINTTPSRRSTEQLATPPRSVQTTPAKEKTTSPTVNRSTTDKPRTESRPAEPTRSSSNQPNRNTGRR